MPKRWPCIVLAALWFVVLGAIPAPAVVGNEWRTLDDAARWLYVAGVVDTWSMVKDGIQIAKEGNPAYTPGASEEAFSTAFDCVAGRPYAQTIAIVDKYMKDHPEKWHYTMAANIFIAIRSTCQP